MKKKNVIDFFLTVLNIWVILIGALKTIVNKPNQKN